MPQDFVLSPDQIAAFWRDGVLRLPGLIPAEKATRAREAVGRRLAQLGLWDWGTGRRTGPRPQWPATGLKPGRDLVSARAEVADVFEDRAIASLIASALGGRAVDHSIHPRPQILVSLPNCEDWVLPRGWHTDSPRLASGESAGVQLFTFLDRVEAQGGGTLVIAGSHRLMNDRGDLKPGDVGRLLRDEAFFRNLIDGASGFVPSEADLPSGVAGNVPVRVVELTGEPGDAWLTDLRVLHAASPNAAVRPRMMATHRYIPADLLPQIAAAYGWR